MLGQTAAEKEKSLWSHTKALFLIFPNPPIRVFIVIIADDKAEVNY